ncbi:MAG: flagellar basal body rod protein FlgB [Phycisphaeraceae bacterium]
MITGMTDTGSMQVLERLVQFTGERHKHLANNVANLSTPGYKPRDLSVDSFQEAMQAAVERRRQNTGGLGRELDPRDTREIKFESNGIRAQPHALSDNILFHDQNNRSLEHTMKDMAENAMTHNAALEMLKSAYTGIETAIRERV